MTPSKARNAIKKCLKAILDPKPDYIDKDQIWHYFANNCAYCGSYISRESRKGHIDHLISEMNGGSNRLCNLVLTCSTCNGDEKRDMEWREFLKSKCENEIILSQRMLKIDNWINMHGYNQLITAQEIKDISSEFNKVNSVFTDSIEKLKNNNSM